MVGKRTEDSSRPSRPRSKNPYAHWRLVIAVPICTLFLVVAMPIVIHPAICDHKPMGQWDRCLHTGRTQEQLVTGSPDHVPDGEYDIHKQSLYNRIIAGAAAGLGTAGWVIVIAWARHEYLRRKARAQLG
ncbi:hypothetical protein [Mycobacteroides salmoniphilum]|uniref:hypothetical protein n=1 Tax=Mycobacteroides salmoniphilum TaxID=404941 RepID=UPI0010655689|nr:hypothetical protein [Mycobacteroides salmoniphilum]TDZ97970.1 hypothetical protein CCUG62472_00999 [Mycobacteroides salmoniphilum]